MTKNFDSAAWSCVLSIAPFLYQIVIVAGQLLLQSHAGGYQVIVQNAGVPNVRLKCVLVGLTNLLLEVTRLFQTDFQRAEAINL